MKILFDHNLPRRLREHLPGHEIRTTREMKWEQLRNGELMSVAAATGFEVFVTVDKQVEHQQNLATLVLTVVVVDGKSNVRRSMPLITHRNRASEGNDRSNAIAWSDNAASGGCLIRSS